MEKHPQRFPNERSKIAYVISLLTRRALQWVESIWTQPGPVTATMDNFVAHFKEVFGLPEGDSSIQTQLNSLRQGKSSISEYAL